jgi:ribosomal protein S8
LKYKKVGGLKPLFSIIKNWNKKPGQRVFGLQNFTDTIDVLRYEQGTAIISTSAGIVSHIKAQN